MKAAMDAASDATESEPISAAMPFTGLLHSTGESLSLYNNVLEAKPCT